MVQERKLQKDVLRAYGVTSPLNWRLPLCPLSRLSTFHGWSLVVLLICWVPKAGGLSWEVLTTDCSIHYQEGGSCKYKKPRITIRGLEDLGFGISDLSPIMNGTCGFNLSVSTLSAQYKKDKFLFVKHFHELC